jgi:hypothetical protein
MTEVSHREVDRLAGFHDLDAGDRQGRVRLRGAGLLVVIGLAVLGGYFVGRATADQRVPMGSVPPEVGNAFWDSITAGSNRTSRVPPESDCVQLRAVVYRCYARWAPVESNRTFIYHGEVVKYPDVGLQVSEVTRRPEQ